MYTARWTDCSISAIIVESISEQFLFLESGQAYKNTLPSFTNFHSYYLCHHVYIILTCQYIICLLDSRARKNLRTIVFLHTC